MESHTDYLVEIWEGRNTTGPEVGGGKIGDLHLLPAAPKPLRDFFTVLPVLGSDPRSTRKNKKARKIGVV